MKRVNEAILTAYLDGELSQEERRWVENQLAESVNLQATLIRLRQEKSQVAQGLDILAPPLPQTITAAKQFFSKNEPLPPELMVWESPGVWPATASAIGKALGNWQFYLQTAVAIGLIVIGVSLVRMWVGSSSEIDQAGTPPVVAPMAPAEPILFTTHPDEASRAKAKIYTIGLDDLALTPLPDLDIGDGFPSLSLAGEQVVVSAAEGGDIVVMNGAGRMPINLTNSPDNLEKYPVLSPDGQRVAFTDGGNVSLIDLEEGRQEIIATGISGYDLVWSPDGQRLAFISAKGDQTDLYVINIDGPNLINLTNDTILEMHPAWSPDGQQIAFADGESLTIVDLTGTNRVKLPYDNPGYHFPRQPLWSPDGMRLAFVASRMALNFSDQIQTLFTIEVDSGQLTPLTDKQIWVGAFFDWSPDGRQLVFAKGEYGQEQLYVMNADGSGQMPLTDDRIKGINYIEWGVR